jgi:hypothetical protein
MGSYKDRLISRPCLRCGSICFGDPRRKECNKCGQNLFYKIPKRGSVRERFDASFVTEPNTGCWLWVGHFRSNGYGEIKRQGIRLGAHRVSHELHIGAIPDGLVVDHLCRVKSCVNPDHLEAVTQQVNVLRSRRRGK